MRFTHTFLIFSILYLGVACEPDMPVADTNRSSGITNSYKTENIVLIVIDGPRFKETWGDPEKKHIPHFANELAAVGIHHSCFYNRGATYTTSGHAAVTTGNYQWMANDGSEIPYYPSIFQSWLETTRFNPMQAQVITSKKKLRVLADCVDPASRGKFNPTVDAEDRADSVTLKVALSNLKTQHPRMMLIHFRGPDLYGHANDWGNYLKSIERADQYTYEIWKFLQQDPVYKNTSTLIVTNDHGRHSNQVRDGFVSHGDFCEGCMHINLYATGPDFQSNIILDQPRQAVDISATIAELMGFPLNNSTGTVMWELFN